MGKRKTTEEFIKQAKELFGDKYDYSETVYTGCYKPVRIICHEKDEHGVEHGAFTPRACNHLSRMGGCPKCSHHTKENTESFVSKAREKYGDKYDYSLVVYKDCDTNVDIICHCKDEDGNEHGVFTTTPYGHLHGSECRFCKGNPKMTKELFIKRARKIHGDAYDYEKVEYKDPFTDVLIFCRKHQAYFNQAPHHHLNGHGCPICSMSLMERHLKTLFDEAGLTYETQKKFDWLKYKRKMSLDFYFPDYNIALECQGEQHIKPVYYRSKKWSKEMAELNLREIKTKDALKLKLCEENKISILYVMNDKMFEIADKEFYNQDNTVIFNNLNDLTIDIIKEKLEKRLMKERIKEAKERRKQK